VTQELKGLAPDQLKGIKYTCRDCDSTHAIMDTGQFLKPKTEGVKHFHCYQCDRDLTSEANTDGLAASLVHAFYLCETCAAGHETARGAKFLGDYYVIKELGRGGMGIVYKAVHKTIRRVSAVKMILPELVRNEYARKVFEREVAVQSKVIHPNLVRVLDQDRFKGIPFFVTEFLGGGDVKNLVSWEFRGPLEPPLAASITIQILRGLEALHEAGFIHRDLKPSNFLLDRSWKEPDFLVKIADYGLAKPFESAGNSMFEYTREGIAAGSYVFIPPEQITNYKYVRPPVDVYAVGASLYYMLTAKYSVDFPDPAAEADKTSPGKKQRHPVQIVLEDPSIPILERNADLPPTLAKVVDRAVEKEVEKRYQSAVQFRAALEEVCVEEGWPLPRH
jgi:serine/threonine-protein kinase